ncbi:hypothetical protein WJX84_012344 [Apatococcus fuscideae]|uniref:RRM domain-containing protein n=1 Tax=Apatococcus fuscideae TaxID=2026836 RepID=A0AAW1SV46_9CHLO
MSSMDLGSYRSHMRPRPPGSAPFQRPPPVEQFISPQDGPAVLHLRAVPVAVDEGSVHQALIGLSGYMQTVLYKPNPPWGFTQTGIPQGFIRITFQTLQDAMNATNSLMDMFLQNHRQGDWCPQDIQVQIRPNLLSAEQRAVKLAALKKRMSGTWNPEADPVNGNNTPSLANLPASAGLPGGKEAGASAGNGGPVQDPRASATDLAAEPIASSGIDGTPHKSIAAGPSNQRPSSDGRAGRVESQRPSHAEPLAAGQQLLPIGSAGRDSRLGVLEDRARKPSSARVLDKNRDVRYAGSSRQGQDEPNQKAFSRAISTQPRSERSDRLPSQRERDRSRSIHRSESPSGRERRPSSFRLSDHLRKRPREPSGSAAQDANRACPDQRRCPADTRPVQRVLQSPISEGQDVSYPSRDSNMPQGRVLISRPPASSPRPANEFRRVDRSQTLPYRDQRRPNDPGIPPSHGLQGMAALDPMPGPALNALLNIVDRSPNLTVEHFNEKNVGLIMRLNNAEYHSFLQKAGGLDWSQIASPAQIISSLARQAQR